VRQRADAANKTNDQLAPPPPGGRYGCSTVSGPRSSPPNAAVTGDELLVRLLNDLDLVEARLAPSPRLRGRPLGLLGARSYALSTRCTAERAASH